MKPHLFGLQSVVYILNGAITLTSCLNLFLVLLNNSGYKFNFFAFLSVFFFFLYYYYFDLDSSKCDVKAVQ